MTTKVNYIFPCGAGYWGVEPGAGTMLKSGKVRIVVFDSEAGKDEGPDMPTFQDVEEVKAGCFFLCQNRKERKATKCVPEKRKEGFRIVVTCNARMEGG